MRRGNKNKSFIIAVFFTLFVGQSWASVEDEALCGRPPQDAKEEEVQREKWSHLSKILPPVTSQNPAGWCYAFSSIPLLEHHRFIEIMKERGIDKKSTVDQMAFAKEFYQDPTNRISPFEAVYSHNFQKSQIHPNAKDVFIPDPDKIDLLVGGDARKVFWGVQERGYALRSIQQVGFTSSDDSGPEAQKIIKGLIERYKKDRPGPTSSGTGDYYEVMGCKVDAEIYNDPDFNEFIRGFGVVNHELMSLAETKQAKNSATSFSSYKELAGLLNKNQTPDIKLPPFTTSFLETDDPIEFLNQIKSSLHDMRPLTMGLCSLDEEFFPASSISDDSGDQCGSHSVSIVGAYYRDGKCVVKLRNSWGTDWPEKDSGGHKEVKVKDLLKLQESMTINKPGNSTIRKNKYAVEWIGPPLGQGDRVFSKFKSGSTGTFQGEGSLKLVTSQGLKPDLKSGLLTLPSGEIVEYENWIIVRFNRGGKWYQRREDGKYYKSNI
jgi:hypothetical protein